MLSFLVDAQFSSKIEVLRPNMVGDAEPFLDFCSIVPSSPVRTPLLPVSRFVHGWDLGSLIVLLYSSVLRYVCHEGLEH